MDLEANRQWDRHSYLPRHETTTAWRERIAVGQLLMYMDNAQIAFTLRSRVVIEGSSLTRHDLLPFSVTKQPRLSIG
jgi:hypothetical protein